MVQRDKMRKIKIFIVDESPFFRRWFRKLILAIPGIRLIGEAEDPLVALKFIRVMKPDAIIMDSKIQWRFGVDLIKRIRTITPVPKVIVLTGAACRRYQRKVSEKADVLLDKITEYNRIPEILKSLASGSASEFN